MLFIRLQFQEIVDENNMSSSWTPTIIYFSQIWSKQLYFNSFFIFYSLWETWIYWTGCSTTRRKTIWINGCVINARLCVILVLYVQIGGTAQHRSEDDANTPKKELGNKYLYSILHTHSNTKCEFWRLRAFPFYHCRIGYVYIAYSIYVGNRDVYNSFLCVAIYISSYR